MADNITDAAAKLKKLGQRIRDGWAKRHPIADKSLETIRRAVREEWQREQVAKRDKPPPARSKSRDRKPPEPER